jgi:uncharacterized protein (TIRG00374 family)
LKSILRPIENKKLWKNIGMLVILGLAAYLVMPQITVLKNSMQVLLHMFLWAVGLSFTAQVFSYLGSGYLLQKTFAITKLNVSLLRSTLIVLGSTSIGLVAGGTVGSSAAIFRWTSAEEGSIESATLASLLPSLFNSLMLALFSIFGLAHLMAAHNLTRVQAVGFSVTLGFLGLAIGLTFLASRYRKWTAAVILWVSDRLRRLSHKPFDQDSARKEIDDIFGDWNDLWRGKWHLLVLGAFLNAVFDMLTLYFLFIASGNHINLGILLSGYALPLLLGRIAFILPGGVGVVESSMAALYTSLGIPDATSVVVVLAYRLISFWIPSLLGFPVATVLQRERNKSHENKKAFEAAGK